MVRLRTLWIGEPIISISLFPTIKSFNGLSMMIIDSFRISFSLGTSFKPFLKVFYLILITNFTVSIRVCVPFMPFLGILGTVWSLTCAKAVQNVFSYFGHMIIFYMVMLTFRHFCLWVVYLRSAWMNFVYFVWVGVFFEVDGAGKVVEGILQIILVLFLFFIINFVLLHVVHTHNLVKVEGNFTIAEIYRYFLLILNSALFTVHYFIYDLHILYIFWRSVCLL